MNPTTALLLTATAVFLVLAAAPASAHPDGHGVVECFEDTQLGPCHGEDFSHQVTSCLTAGREAVAECVGDWP